MSGNQGASEIDADGRRDAPDDTPTLGDLLDELDALHDTVDSPAERDRVEELIETVHDVEEPAVFGRLVVGFDRADAAEALLGSVLFGIPMVVEGGTLEVGAFVATHPLSLVGTLVVALGLTIGILYVAEFQDVRVYKPLFGVLPRRLVGVVTIAFLTALGLMTIWGRVDWAEPWLAISQISVAFVPMVIGAALGDILPG
ncbi:DUF2391 domain-containing protein [Halorientalis brevis]|uniref:DUF2391 domain-containing protein n=1 Tax=Halorientalis brevis TaxID=1126241 RepID=A0ABD6CFJ5_9EURY|nr:DUF2391 domain-containing protein [Halorientalis brevis]